MNLHTNSNPTTLKARDKILLTLLAIAILALYSSWGRPLWLDEYLHFVFGGFDSIGDAWAAIQGSTTNINHGQTGFYMIIDFALLKTFGANLFMMRLPSLLSGALLLFSAALFLRRKNLGVVAIAAAFLLLLAQPNLMYFAGEARPYMPMVASSMAALAYFSTDRETRATRGMRILGWGSMIWGALMMPYYVLYLPVIALTAFMIAKVNGEKPQFIKFINLPLQITSVILGTGISAFTWLQDSPHFSRDPWLTIRPLVDSITAPQLIGLIFLGALVVFTIWQGLIHATNRAKLEKQLAASTLLILVMLAMSILFAALSLSQSYWILPRQFVASQAIITIAVVWLLGSALLANPRRYKTAIAALFALGITLGAGRATINQIDSLRDWENNGYPVAGNPGDGAFRGIEVGPANQNVIDGGPVRPEFTVIYDEPRYGPGEDPAAQ
jgi:hypothetical protein